MGLLDIHHLFFLCFCLFSPVICLNEESRDGKFSIFQIIKFQNDPCTGGTRNGTCFTSAECTSAGGTKDGTCADGFGVCCITIISAGATTSLNQSYIVQTSTATSSRFTICPCSTDVCRIRFDFTTFTLAGPASNVGTQAAASTLLTANTGTESGDCITDTFSITGAFGSGTPVICGANTGQHVIVDSDGSECSIVNLGIGGGTTTRSLDIRVTQFKCGEEMGGPPGCLQWFTTTTGTIRSFNFPSQAAGATVAASVVHLSNQNYKSCVRKPAGATVLCLAPCTVVTAASITNMPATAQNSFGLSISQNAAAKSSSGTLCSTDYITIPGGINNLGAGISTQGVLNRFCGRCLETTAAGVACTNAVTTSVCTNRTPWHIGVVTNEDEVALAAGAGTAIQTEASLPPGGIVGFSLCYTTL